MTAEHVSSRGKDNKQHLDENRLTLTYNKRRSPFHLPTAERLGATGGEPPQRVREEPSGWATGGELTVHIKLVRSDIVNGIGGHKKTAENCRMYRMTQANGGKLSHPHRQSVRPFMTNTRMRWRIIVLLSVCLCVRACSNG